MAYFTREEWLVAASASIRSRVESLAKRTYGAIAVSVGFAKGARGRKRAVGQCWKRDLARDSKSAIFVCPTQEDPEDVLAILLHEHCHAAVDPESGHRGVFKECASAVGPTKPFTQSIPSPELVPWLEELAKELGPYPHAALSLPPRGEKGSRLRLWKCACEGPEGKARVASDAFKATCQTCGEEFKR